MTAVSDGDHEQVRTLLKLGADANFQNEWGETPLHLAGIPASVECVDALVASGADVNALTHGEYKGHAQPVKRTPLMWMIYTGPKKAPLGVAALLKHGARVRVKNEEGNDTLDLVRLMGQASADISDMLPLLEAADAKEAASEAASAEL